MKKNARAGIKLLVTSNTEFVLLFVFA